MTVWVNNPTPAISVRGFNTARELGFRGSFDEWERSMGAVAKR